ncbi:TPA: hypothetical protein N0F65_011900 [Lagenidium giganteum]|uniref:Uncharacterized protein n=1 Tax=Lagenidium giganteum TaxID=4803 RepID=A0AAV2YLT0_9STRA|nr:TPA: hypothetical protein N0F65_011900 [Lagenidium giganteum]
MRVQPLHDVEVAVARSQFHGAGRASFGAHLMQPLHQLEVAVHGRVVHRARRASFRALLVQPLHDSKVSVLGGVVHGSRRAVAQPRGRVQPLQHGQVAELRRKVHEQRGLVRRRQCQRVAGARQVLQQVLPSLGGGLLHRPAPRVVDASGGERPHVWQVHAMLLEHVWHGSERHFGALCLCACRGAMAQMASAASAMAMARSAPSRATQFAAMRSWATGGRHLTSATRVTGRRHHIPFNMSPLHHLLDYGDPVSQVSVTSPINPISVTHSWVVRKKECAWVSS